MKKKYIHEPDYDFHPGETLLETLEALGMSQSQLAERMGRPSKTINEIIKGKAAITAETSLELERVTNVPASFWNNAQRNYETFIANQAEAEVLSKSLDWLKAFPITTLWALGWVPKVSDPVEQLRSILNFFGVAGVEEWQAMWEQPEVAFRKSNVFSAHPMSVAAWLRKGELEAQQIKTKPYDKDKFTKALLQIKGLTMKEPEEFVPAMHTLCADSGVALVFVPEVKGTRAYGATRWIGSEKAILQLSLRGKADDFLWFTFLHEAGHILKHGKKDVFIESPEGANDEEVNRKEAEADRFSAEFLISADEYRDLLSKAPFSSHKIKAFADKLKIAPGIVVGRLQHEKMIGFDQLNTLKRRLKFKDDAP